MFYMAKNRRYLHPGSRISAQTSQMTGLMYKVIKMHEHVYSVHLIVAFFMDWQIVESLNELRKNHGTVCDTTIEFH